MEDEVIREVETDSKGRVLVTIEETAEDVAIPPRCAGCLGEPTMRLPIVGVDWLDFPYCEECEAPRPKQFSPRTVAPTVSLLAIVVLALIVSWWILILGLLVLPTLRRGSGGRAVTLLVSESGTVRLAFQNEEYARLFVEANEPPESEPDPAQP
jgi:hypothetical protein